MADKIFTVDDGMLEIEIKNKKERVTGRFYINPADTELVPRTEAVIERFNKLSYPDEQDSEKRLAALKAFTADIHDMFNTLLGYNASPELFEGCGATALTPDGDFYFEKILAYIVSVIEDATKKRVEKKMAKISKATAKYTG